MIKYKFIGCTSEMQARFGGCADPTPYFKIGEIVEPEEIQTHSYHTRLIIDGIPFNKQCFEEFQE